MLRSATSTKTAGASAPEILVKEVIDRIKALGVVSVCKMAGIEETIKFPLPKGLKLHGPALDAMGSDLHAGPRRC